jgi:osmotically-inducible protein OsmY
MQLATSSALPGSDAAIDSCSDATPWHSHLRSQAAAIPWFQRQPIRLTGRRGQAVLAGVVSSYYEKQLAQEFARRFEGVVEIDNRLEVRYRSFARLSDHHG